MARLSGLLSLFFLVFSMPCLAAMLKAESSFSTGYSVGHLLDFEPDARFEPQSIDTDRLPSLRQHPVVMPLDLDTDYSDKADVNVVIYQIGLAVIPRRRSYFRIHDSKGAFPYKQLPEAANLYLLNRLRSYHTVLRKPGDTILAGLGIRIERSEPGFPL